jgi:hypothetical protein
MAMHNSSADGGSGSGGTMSQVKEAGSQVMDQATDKMGDLVDRAKPQIESQKDRVAENLSSTADALRQTGQQLRSKDESAMVGEYVERAAAGVERFAGYLRDRPLDQLMRDAEGFARRQPAVFLCGAFGLGLIAARFLKSSGGSGGPEQGSSRGQTWSGSGSAMRSWDRPTGSADYRRQEHGSIPGMHNGYNSSSQNGS